MCVRVCARVCVCVCRFDRAEVGWDAAKHRPKPPAFPVAVSAAPVRQPSLPPPWMVISLLSLSLESMVFGSGQY